MCHNGDYRETTHMDAAITPRRDAPIVFPRVFFMLWIHVIKITIVPVAIVWKRDGEWVGERHRQWG